MNRISGNLGVNEVGNLTIGGVDTVALAAEYGTPLYVMDEDKIIENCCLYRDSIDKFYDGKGLVCYASKAFSCKQIYRIIKSQGIGVDVVSMGELYTAMSVGFDPLKICYHGNNKSRDELVYALRCGVSRIVVDAVDELKLLSQIASELNVTAGIMLRLSPGIDAHTHSFIQTGQIDSKFGFPIETGAAMDIVMQALNLPNIILMGIHCHIGSQIFDLEPFEHTAQVMMNFIQNVKNETGHEIHELNLGGGFGTKYVDSDTPVAYDNYMEKVSMVVKRYAFEMGIKLPFIIIEPGRSIVAQAGLTLYTIGNIKEIKGVRTYVAVDGGMNDNMRYALYGSEYSFIVANKARQPKTKLATIAGRCCESGDLLGKDVAIQECASGDVLATLVTGAYNYSMSSNYNRTLKPAVVFLKDGQSFIGIKRETLQDIVRNDM